MAHVDLDKRWRVGRSVGRTIYVVYGDEPSKWDKLIGMMDTQDLAREVVEAHNEKLMLKQRG